MDPIDIASLTRPDTSTMLSDTAAVLAASSTISDTADHHQNASYVQLRRLAIIVFTIFFTDSTSQTYKLLLAHTRTKLVTFPPNYSYFVPVVIIFASIAEYQQPGCIPRLSALFGFGCAAAVFFSCLACLEFVEERKWPWQEDGWVWPWEAWLWRDTVYELGASTSSELMPSHWTAFAPTNSDNKLLLPPLIISAESLDSGDMGKEPHVYAYASWLQNNAGEQNKMKMGILGEE